MSTLALVIDLVFRLVTLLFVVRFLLQAAKADFYNPISQAIVKATDPVTRPLRALVRPMGQLDFASLIVAWIVGMLYYALFDFVLAPRATGVGTLLANSLVYVVLVTLQFYFIVIFITIIASLIAPGNYNPAITLLNQLVDPILRPIRAVLPTLGPLDFSPMVAILGLMILQNLLRDLTG